MDRNDAPPNAATAVQPTAPQTAQPTAPPTPLSRRHLLVGAGAGATLLAVAACGGTNGGTDGGTSAGSGAAAPSSGGSGAGGSLATVADVPVGGAVSATDASGAPVIVAQPTKGEVVAFSAICTHRGCTVAPQGDQLVCPCHGSTYDLATGDNTGGPAPRPLAKISVSVKAGKVVES
jgi:cytochrome b6-f complex iron-sulfur subunit